LIFSKIQQVLGGKLLLVLSGGAPLSQETWRFMNTCFGNLVQGYGLTETCAGTSISQREHHSRIQIPTPLFSEDEYTIGSVGPPISTCEIRLREWKEGGYSPYNELPQGEILVGGKNVVLGYFKNEAKTKEDFLEIDGQRYFATGDIGEIHQDGTLRIIGRQRGGDSQ
jgi:long-chain acyl-CoA synthetase